MKSVIIRVVDWFQKLLYDKRFKRMNTLLNQCLEELSKIQHVNFSDIIFKDGKLYFKYKGGQFLIIKSVSNNLDLGYLKLYFDDTLPKSHIKQIDGFDITINSNQIFITKLSKSNSVLSPTLHNGTHILINKETLVTSFIREFEAKLVNDNFEIIIAN